MANEMVAQARVDGMEQESSVDILLGSFLRRLDSLQVVTEVTEALMTWSPEGRAN